MVQQRSCRQGAATAQVNVVPAGRRPTARDGCAGGMSPRKRGVLARGYEDRLGTASILEQDAATCASSTPRPSKKPGVTCFTDPMNPFSRALSKHMTRIGDARNDADRAGARTRNPGIIARDGAIPRDRPLSEDGRHPLVAHSYSTVNDWRPSKRCPEHVPAGCTGGIAPPAAIRSPRCSEGLTSALNDSQKKHGHGTNLLENYLNDMKRTSRSLRSTPATPSAFLLRMNDERVKLPADRRAEREQFSAAVSEEQSAQQESARIRRSVSCDPRFQRSSPQGDVSEREDSYGFTRKREVSGDWTGCRGTRDLLHHTPGHSDPPCTPRRTERLQHRADERFEEMVAHMKAANPAQKLQFEHFKVRGEHSAGLITHDMSPRAA